ncbi:MAG: signal peptidase I [Lentisphaeria bacterium]
MRSGWRHFLWPEWNRRFLVRLAVVAAAAWLLFSQFLLPLRIRGASMEPAYHDGGVNLCFRGRYWFGTPRRFDVVAVRLAGTRVMLLKRVLALPGETVAFQHGRLLVDGQPVTEPQPVLAGGDWELPPRRVAPGRLFVAGDNRSMPIEQHVLGEAELERVAGAPVW